MNYIQKLKYREGKFLAFYDAYKAFALAQDRYPSAAYKGDAMNEIKKTREILQGLIKEFDNELIPDIRKEDKRG